MQLVPGEREGGPKKLGAIADTAFAAYAHHAGFYLLAAVVLALLQGAVSAATRDNGVLLALNVFADALLTGIVVIGTASVLSGSAMPARSILGATVERLWYLCLLQLFVALAAEITLALMLADPADSFGLTTVLTAYVWGFLQFPVVTAAIEAPGPNPIFGALAHTALVTGRLRVLVRVMLLGLLTLPPAFLQVVVSDQLQHHGMAALSPGITAALDALLAGPYAAFVTVFYLDLKRRER